MNSVNGVSRDVDVATIRGSVTPRIYTPPLVTGPPGPCGCGCALTEDTSMGFDWTTFAKRSFRRPFRPWQRWQAIHGGELLPNGLPRFRYVWVMVARQNGKTELPTVLSGYWMYVDAVPMILGTSTNLVYAKESFFKVVGLIEESDDPLIRELTPSPKFWREANGEQEAWAFRDHSRMRTRLSRYKIAASNERGGRSLTVNRLILDEIREHHDYSAWGAAEPTMNTVKDAQMWALSNAGDDRSIVLNDAREEALTFIETGVGNPRVGWFEYSAPEDAEPDDPYALAQANPEFNGLIDGRQLVEEGAAARRKGGEKLARFRTEKMCIHVRNLAMAIDASAWNACNVPGTLDGVRERIALVFDVAPDGQHATLTAAAALPDGRVRVEPVAAWTFGAADHGMDVMIKELKEHVRKIVPAAFGWLPTGPAAAYAAELTAKNRDGKLTRPRWLPKGTRMEEIRGDLPAVCMGFEEQVKAAKVLHSGDPLQDAHVLGAQRLTMGDRWVFTRRGGGHCDAAYSAAGAVHLARTMPAPMGKPRLIIVGDSEA